MLKNIVIVNDWAHVDGGASNVAINSAMELAKFYRVYLFSAIQPIDEKLYKAGVNVVCIDKQDILHDKNRLRAIWKGLWDNDAKHQFEELLATFNRHETIVHFHTWTKALSASLYSVTAKMQFKTVITFHDFFCFCPNGGFFNYQRNEICTKRPMSLSCLICHCDTRNYSQKIWRSMRMAIQNHVLWRNRNLYFISISKLTQRICLPLIKGKYKVYYIPDPVELNSRQPNKLLDNDTYIFMGRLSPEKGVRLFCQAVTDLKLKAIVLGEGYLKDELQRDFPNIHFAGWVSGEEKHAYLSKAKTFLFTSLWYETFGLSVAEAKSYGIPCIVPDKCAASEQVEDGKTGYVFKTGDLDSLKEAILRNENADIQAIQNNILQEFNINDWRLDSHIVRLIDCYKEIISSK